MPVPAFEFTHRAKPIVQMGRVRAPGHRQPVG